MNFPKVKAVLKASEASTHPNKAVLPVVNQVFQLHSNLLLDKAWYTWNMVLDEQIDCKPLLDLYGDEHTKKPQKSWGSFIGSMTFHLLTTFCNEAAKMDCF